MLNKLLISQSRPRFDDAAALENSCGSPHFEQPMAGLAAARIGASLWNFGGGS